MILFQRDLDKNALQIRIVGCLFKIEIEHMDIRAPLPERMGPVVFREIAADPEHGTAAAKCHAVPVGFELQSV